MARAPADRRDEITRLIEGADIVDVATKLGLQVEKRRAEPQRAICPFHHDKDPSLNLYRRGSQNSTRGNYHCFVCGAHGDALKLIQDYEQLQFIPAVSRLAELLGSSVNVKKSRHLSSRSAAATLSELIKAFDITSPPFRAVSEARGYAPEWLHQANVAILDLRSTLSAARNSREAEEGLISAGVARRIETDGAPELIPSGLKGFYFGERLLFQINDLRGDTVGYAARALSDERPKYLFSYGLPKSNLLYRADKVYSKLADEARKKIKSDIEIYIVEGLFDALRLESLGLHAVAILGASLVPSQLQVLRTLLDFAAQDNRHVTLNLFLDRDEAGRRGAYDAAILLLQNLKDVAPFSLVFTWPKDTASGKVDPDGLLQGITPGHAQAILVDARISALNFLAGVRLNTDPYSVNWKTTDRLRLASAARQIGLAFQKVNWPQVESVLGEIAINNTEQQLLTLIGAYADPGTYKPHRPGGLQDLQDPSDDRANLLSALLVGRSSSSRREYPLDDAAWDRLSVAASTLFHMHRARLSFGDGPSTNLLARSLPKGEGRYRLKSGPSPEDILLHQYVLLELLRERPECPDFASQIPAVRYDRNLDAKSQVYWTGQQANHEAVSFAYQIDMAIVNGISPPRREGIFRPYFECWRNFISYIEGKIKEFHFEEMQVLRLDITSFYDHVRRGDVQNTLQRHISGALHNLHLVDGDIKSFAPLLRPDAIKQPEERAEATADFLLLHTFGLTYRDPETGVLTETDKSKGIPQGPDLSAYLANITLFGLDEMMVGEVAALNASIAAEGKCAAAYARYVDDIVIVCQDIDVASQLRRKIETHLAALKLTLNRKNPIPAPMSRAEAREWITDNRSGFGFSGPLADLPTTEAMDPLADAGEIDRKTALGLIFDPELDDPGNVDEACVRISNALDAPDLRFSDKASAYRRLWIFAANNSQATNGKILAKQFLDYLLATDNQVLYSSETELFDVALASFEGLDRAVRSVVPPGIFDEAVCDDISTRLDLIGEAIIGDVFTPLALGLLGDQAGNKFLSRYDIRTQIAMMVRFSAAKKHEANPTSDLNLSAIQQHLQLPDGNAHDMRIDSSLLWSLHRFDSRVIAQSPIIAPNEKACGAAFTQLHSAIVRLQRFANYGSDEDLSSVPNPSQYEPTEVVRLAKTILAMWGPNETNYVSTTESYQLDLDAASTLVNLVHKRFVELAEKRPGLLKMVAGTKGAIALPSPAGLESRGIMLWSTAEKKLLLACPTDVDDAPLGVTWLNRSPSTVDGVSLKVADLPIGVEPICSTVQTWTPASIAKAYRDFYQSWRSLQQDDKSVPIPTVYSFFGRYGNDGALQDSRVICWVAQRATVDGHAFVRVGGALEAKSVFRDGSDYWRYGWAIRDLCNRAELLPDTDVDAHASVSLEKDFHRREAIIARVLPRLSGADQFGPGEIKEGTIIPTRISRGLTLLENFEVTGSAALDTAYLVAAIAEGMFMSERIGALATLNTPGFPSTLLLRAARRAMKAVPEAAAHWPPVSLRQLPYRRSSAAWFAVDTRLSEGVSRLAPSAQLPLNVMALGADVLGTVSDLRSLAFEMAAGIDPADIEQLADIQFDINWIRDNAGLDCLLVEGASESLDAGADYQIGLLVRIFSDIVLGRRAGLNLLRDSITPCGWTVIVAILLQVVEIKTTGGRDRPTFWPVSLERRTQAELALSALLKFLAAKSEGTGESENWPWDAFSELQALQPANLVAILRSTTDVARILVSDETSSTNPRTNESIPGKEAIRLAGGSVVMLADWQIDLAYIRGEKGAATEAMMKGGRLAFRYSVAKMGEQVLGVHLASRVLATMAFGKTNEALDISERPTDGTLRDQKNEPLTKFEKIAEIAEAQEEDESRNVEDASNSSAHKLPDLSESTDTFNRILKIQRSTWRARGETKAHTVQRLAFVQWDVTDSYYAPGYKEGKPEGLLSLDGSKVTPEAVKEGGLFLSTTEYRRRAILRSVVSACIQFGVEGLVLPEYSLRPETVNWLSRHLVQAGTPLTVWCGTFRVPGGTQIDFDVPGATNPYHSAEQNPPPPGRVRYDYHSSIHTCLRALQGDSKVTVTPYMRRKRLPSVAAGELIRPPLNEPWRPLLQSVTDPFDVGTFAIELICSEIFPHASSANFVAIIEEIEALIARYGMPPSSESAFEFLSQDVYSFANWTSQRSLPVIKGGQNTKFLSRGKRLQRTLIVLSTMTNRSADYHIFGQAQYLAAGLVTVFCNAVIPNNGVGGSCFIGLDGWAKAEPVATPYGLVAPGIFEVGGEYAGPLGRNEAAMVIADLDLLRTTDQKPRPQYQARALKLVAHLPLIFQTSRGAGNEPGDYPTKQRRTRRAALPGETQAKTFPETGALIQDALILDQEWRKFGNPLQAGKKLPASYTDAIKGIDHALTALEQFADDAEWLKKRRKYFLDHRYETPTESPLPYLTDWIYVDDSWSTIETSSDAPATASDYFEEALRSDLPVLAVQTYFYEPPKTGD